VVEAEATVRARGHEFQGRVAGGRGVVRMRPLIGPTGIAGEWRVLGDGPAPELAPGRVTDVEFSHVDQGLRLCVGGREVASGTYDWTPAERVRFSTGRELSALMERQDPQGRNVLADPGLYVQPEARWTFTMAAGAGFRLHRVGLDRDLHYLPTTYRNTETGARIDPQGPALATNPLSTLRLGPDEFFPCGDNSPSSLDGRLMDSVDPWVAHDFDDRLGVVHRDLLLGRAFFVYWPSLIREKGPVTAPDFGRMRFIW
jgi:hypothetical protein